MHANKLPGEGRRPAVGVCGRVCVVIVPVKRVAARGGLDFHFKRARRAGKRVLPE